MYYVATLILEYEKMVKAITLRELTPKVLCQVLYKHLFAHLVVLTTLVLLSLIDQQIEAQQKI